VPMKVDHSGGDLIDSGMTRWADRPSDECTYAFVLRVFYNTDVTGRVYGCERARIGRSDIGDIHMTLFIVGLLDDIFGRHS